MSMQLKAVLQCDKCGKQAVRLIDSGLPTNWKGGTDPCDRTVRELIDAPAGSHLCGKCSRVRPATSPMVAARHLREDLLEANDAVIQATWRMPLDSDIPRLVVFADRPIDYPEEFAGYAVDVYSRSTEALQW